MQYRIFTILMQIILSGYKSEKNIFHIIFYVVGLLMLWQVAVCRDLPTPRIAGKITQNPSSCHVVLDTGHIIISYFSL